MGDLNVRVRKVPVSNVDGVFGKDTVNVNGEVLKEFTTFNELKITNSFFCRKGTCLLYTSTVLTKNDNIQSHNNIYNIDLGGGVVITNPT